ncbi:hypothetical protein SprV_0100495400 [Sparganum proliferum]
MNDTKGSELAKQNDRAKEEEEYFEQMRKQCTRAVDFVTDYLQGISRYRVFPDIEPGFLRPLLPAEVPQTSESWDKIFEDVDNILMRGKYKAEIEEHRRQCVHTLGDPIAADLGKTISALAHHRQAKKREVLERKLTKLKPPGTERSNLVHNLSSKQLTEQQLRVLEHETCFNTADADPVDFIAALEAMLVRSETSDDMKHSSSDNVLPPC